MTMALAKPLCQITGLIRPASEFRLQETLETIDVAQVFAVLNGHLAAYRIRKFLPPTACNKIVENFRSSPKSVPRYGEGEDGVEGYLLGASHIEKTTMEYLTEARDCEEAVQSLYQDTINPLDKFRQGLIGANSPYKSVRPAQHQSYYASNSKAVYWNSLGNFLLQPHDDFAQLRDPAQRGFEIQKANRVMAINFYAIVPPQAGQLKIWNIEPNDASRAALNLTYSGFPYPPELLDEFESLVIPVETGELCVINGNLIHAVLRGETAAASKDRLLITCFMTFNEDNELVWWT